MPSVHVGPPGALVEIEAVAAVQAEGGGFAGTVSVGASTLVAIVSDVADRWMLLALTGPSSMEAVCALGE